MEYLSTPLSSNVPSPSELMGRQFQGLLLFFEDHGTPESVQKQVMLQKEKEKSRHDAVAHDLKTWSIGRVKSHEGRSYVVATEDGRLISRIGVHL